MLSYVFFVYRISTIAHEKLESCLHNFVAPAAESSRRAAFSSAAFALASMASMTFTQATTFFAATFARASAFFALAAAFRAFAFSLAAARGQIVQTASASVTGARSGLRAGPCHRRQTQPQRASR